MKKYNNFASNKFDKQTHVLKIRFSIYGLLIFVLLTVSCSTEKNTAASRAYHNLTAHYNAYFNGKEAYKQGVKKTAKSLNDNFALILPLFPYSSESAASSAKGDMDVAITKASKVIKLHSITKKPKRKKRGKLTDKEKEFYSQNEYCKWINDSWQLMGQAHFYNHDFYLARDNFEYIIREYSKDPIKYKAMIWLARTYNELGNYSKALEILENADGDEQFPKKLKKDLNLTFADNYLKQKKYNDAIPYLTDAIAKEHRKRVKARYQFVLAQIYQRFNQYQMASKLFQDVIKANPDYDMTFNAKIYRATSFDVNNGDSREIKKQLNKMARDDKNIDYLDQIYYALANVEIREGNTEKAIDLYKKSAQSSTNNTDQKAMSFLSLADIYFERKDYSNAQFYYDSTMAFISQEYPDYESLKIKSDNLNELINHLTTIQTEDSLQRVAAMSEKDRDKLIDKLIQKVIEEEARIKQQQLEQQRNSMQYYQNMDRVNSYNNQSGGKWYFYNTAALSFGRSQFIKKWGKRKLEDNWRRKNKTVVSFDTGEPEDESQDSTQKVMDNKTPGYYLQNLPLTDSLIDVSNNKIIDAYYKSGEVYKDKLLDFPKAIAQYETLLKKYPENVYKLNIYYQLFKLYTLTEDKITADKYKNLIISEYPESNYAKMLTNPNYLQEIEAKEKKMKEFYIETYNLYNKKDYLKVIENCNRADSTLKDSPLMSKFSLLKALSIGGIRDLNNFRKALKFVMATYPETDEKTTAEILYNKISLPDFAFKDSGLVAYIGSDLYHIEDVPNNNNPVDSSSTQIDTATVNVEEFFTYKPDIPHFYAMVVPAKTNINRLKYNIFNYNVDRFNMFDFKVSVIDLDNENKIITIKILDNAKQALAYYKNLEKDSNELFLNMKKPDYKDFVITLENFAVVQDKKNVDLYLEFFNKKYRKESSNE